MVPSAQLTTTFDPPTNLGISLRPSRTPVARGPMKADNLETRVAVQSVRGLPK